jgi:hypothetical protein
MRKRITLNTKLLTKKQVQDLVESEGKLHEEFTKIFEEEYNEGYIDQPQIYELLGDRFLFVFDPQGTLSPGKGNIYRKEYFLRWVKWMQRYRENASQGLNSSTSHWRFYSKNKVKLINKISKLIDDLVAQLSISNDQLDFSYKSLDILSSKLESYGREKVQSELYDNVVAYVGEVLRLRIEHAHWYVRKDSSNLTCPVIGVNEDEYRPVLMPINVVWQELTGIEEMNLRKEATNEVRQFLRKSQYT